MASQTVTFEQKAAGEPLEGADVPEAPSTTDSDPGKKDLIRPRNLSPEYERRIAEEWQATMPKVGAADETIKKGASPAEESFDLNISNRRLVEDPTDENADYVLLEEIGKGGMGQVWSARQAALDRTIAIKIPHADVSKQKASDSRQGTEARNQFVSEVIVTGRLDHPNIVPIHDIAHTQSGQLFCSMKKVDGRPWNECIRSTEFTREKNLEILMKVCDAIRYAHDKHGIIHRDLKPHNIVVGDFGEVSVMDFGLALELDKLDTNEPLSLAGSPAYMAPEMATCNTAEIGFHTDVYLLGAILYEIITGSPPHPAPARTESNIKRIQHFQQIASRNEIMPTEEKGELVDIAYQALATSISDRFQSVQEFQDAIWAFREHQKSVTLSKRGSEYLESALNGGRQADSSGSRFDVFDRARFAFDEAIRLWGNNREAHKGAERTRVEYAKYALEQHAYAQGIALLDEHNPEHATLLSDLQKAKRGQENARKARKRLWQSVFALAAALVVGAFVALYLINEGRKEAKENERIAKLNARAAVDAKLDSKKNELTAFRDQLLATLEETKALHQKGVADAQKEIAEKAEFAAIEARTEAVRAKGLAERSAYVAEIGLAAAEAKRNAFDNLRQALSRVDELLLSSNGRSQDQRDGDRQISNVPIDSDRVEVARTEFEGKVEELQSDLAKDDVLRSTAESDPELKKKQEGLRKYLKELSVQAQESVDRVLGSTEDTPDFDRAANPGDSIASADEKQDPRGWEWGYLKYLSENELGVRDLVSGTRSPDNFECVAVAPDQSCVVAGTTDGKLYIWKKNEATDDFWQIIKEPGFGGIASVALKQENDGSCLLALASKRGVALLDLTDEAPAQLLSGRDLNGSARSVSFSDDGSQFAAGWEDGRVAIWPIATGKTDRKPLWLSKRIDQAVASVKFSTDGSRIVTASIDGYVGVWNAVNGEPIEKFSNGEEPVYTAEFLPAAGDKEYVISGDREGKIKVWQLANDEEVGGFNNRRIENIKNRLAAQQVQTDADTFEQAWNAHNAAIHSIRVLNSEAGTTIISAGDDNAIKIWTLSPQFEIQDKPQSLRGHGGWVRGCAHGSGARQIFSAGYDGRVRRWDLGRYRIAHILRSAPMHDGSRHEYTSVAYSQDGKWIATTTWDGLLTFWDMTKPGEPRETHPAEGHDFLATRAKTFANGQFMLTSAGDNTTRIWEVSSGRELAKLGSHWRESNGTGTGFRGIAAVSVDGDLIATGSDQQRRSRQGVLAKIWRWRDQGSKQLIQSMLVPDGSVNRGEYPEATALAFSPDSKTLMVGDQFGTCRLYDVDSGQLLTDFGHRGKVSAAKFIQAESGYTLMTASSDGNVIQWKINNDVATEVVRLRHDKRRVAAMDVSANGSQVVTASVSLGRRAEKYDTQFHFWDLSKQLMGDDLEPAMSSRKIAGIATYIELDPQRPTFALFTNSNLLGSAFNRDRYSVGEWNFATDEISTQRSSRSSEIAMATYLPKRDRNSFVTIGGRGASHFLNSDTAMTYRFQGEMISGSFSPDSSTFVCASADGTAKFWSFNQAKNVWESDEAGKKIGLHNLSNNSAGALRSVKFHPTRNDTILTAGRDGIARVWKKEGRNWQERFAVVGENQQPLESAVFSKDGSKIITAGEDRFVRIWLLNNDQVSEGPEFEHDTAVVAVAISPEGSHIVSAAGNLAYVWDITDDRQPYMRIPGHAADVTAVSFCKNRDRIATASKDQTVRIWDTSGEEAKQLLTLEEHSDHVTSLAFIPEGMNYDRNEESGAYLLTGSLDGEVILRPSTRIRALGKNR